MKLIKNLFVFILSAAVLVASLALLTRLVQPKYDGGEFPLEGNFTSEYYDETTDHDVLMIGDCEVYENFDPITLWKEYGITSYIRGNAQQLTWQSYYLLEEALERETPKVVIYNVQALTHKRPEKEEYNRMTLDGMKWSKTKWDAVRASMCKGERFIDYLFPLLRYHSRFTSLGEEDITYFMTPRKVTCNGYYMRIDTLPASEGGFDDTEWIQTLYPGQIAEPVDNGKNEDEDDSEKDPADEDKSFGEIDDPWADIDLESLEEGDDVINGGALEDEGDAEADETEADDAEDTEEDESPIKDEGEKFGDRPMKYLEMIRTLCESKGIKLILIKAPSLSPRWYDSQEEQVVGYAEEHNLPYINFYKLIKETGIDYETDTYDGGLHMNYNGATKLSKWLGKELKEKYGINDHRADKKLAGVYREKVEWQQKIIDAQKAELDLYGEIKNY